MCLDDGGRFSNTFTKCKKINGDSNKDVYCICMNERTSKVIRDSNKALSTVHFPSS